VPGSEIVEALHRFLSWTPAKLLGVAVADLTVTSRAMNQPGTARSTRTGGCRLAGPDGKPVLLEDLMDLATGPAAWPAADPIRRALSRGIGGLNTMPFALQARAAARAQARCASRCWAARARVTRSRFSDTSRRRAAVRVGIRVEPAWDASTSAAVGQRERVEALDDRLAIAWVA
jgi:hypothetical protein